MKLCYLKGLLMITDILVSIHTGNIININIIILSLFLLHFSRSSVSFKQYYLAESDFKILQ